MSRYIDADKIEYEEMLCSRGNGMYVDCEIAYKDVIDGIPTADVRENVRGEWRMADENYGHAHEFICTACGESVFYDHYTRRCYYDFCPNCGADMKGGKHG